MYPHHLHHHSRPFPNSLNARRLSGGTSVEIILLKSELMHDVRDDINRLEKQRKLQETLILTNGESDDYTITRQLDRAISQVVARLQAYLLLPSPYAHRIASNHAGGWQEKSIYLAFPDGWPAQNIDPIRDAVHNYIVRSVEYNLLLVTLSNDPFTVMCHEEATASYNEINTLINTRHGPTNVHPTFLG